MRLGGPVHADYDTPKEWIDALEAKGYRTATAPVGPDASDEQIAAYAEAAEAAGIRIAEVGAWEHNPISDDPKEREAAVEASQRHLELADRLGADCCVNVAGSRADGWADPHPENFTDETFYRIVESVQEIIDGVEPTDTDYTLEPMPWIYPDDVESHRSLLEAVDRERFGVHFDPVNMITGPRRYYRNAEFVQRFVEELGDYIRVVHLKDVTMTDELTVHVEEVRPGAGELDYHVLLSALSDLDHDPPMLLEHLDSEEEYEKAAEYVRDVAEEVGVSL